TVTLSLSLHDALPISAVGRRRARGRRRLRGVGRLGRRAVLGRLLALAGILRAVALGAIALGTVALGTVLGAVVDRAARRQTREQHRAELELRGRLDAVERRLIGSARDGDHDVAAERRDLRLGDTGGVDALADDGDRLVELLLRRRGLALGDDRLEDHLRAALEVEG